ncbi:MAG TPA: S-methyl-5-thioribose kinase [Chthoniobacterales bacterium]|nr:S-methyl-5-thioribose kinase [Chthoniobacterales bacterium]
MNEPPNPFPEYRPLDPDSVIGFVSQIQPAREALGDSPEGWQAREVGDGNLNLVFIVTGANGAVVVKQALPYLRIAGDAWALPLERAYFESEALTEEAKLVPKLLPKLYHYDSKLAAIVMEFLSPHIILRKGFIQGIRYPRLAGDISEFMAQTLFKTSDLYLNAATKKQRMATFCRNTELCRITEDLVFTDPYRIAKLNRWTTPQLDDMASQFRQDGPLKGAAQRLKLKFLTSAEALIHGDLHSGSIMATPEDTRVIDPEFAFYGPMGFDVGAVIGNLLLAFLSQEGHESSPGQRKEYRTWILQTVEETWNRFEQRFLELWHENASGDAYHASLFGDSASLEALDTEQRNYLRRLFHDSVGFAGVKMIRRILGLAHVEDLEAIKDPDLRARCEHKALRLGRLLVLESESFSKISEVTAAARQEYSHHES